MKTALRSCRFVSLALVLALPAGASASGFTFSQQSATASGTGGAGAAREFEPGLCWLNPAALADGRGMRLGLGLTLGVPSITAEARDGSVQTDSETSVAPVPHLDVAWSGGAFVMGIALGVPFGSSVTWPSDWPGRRENRLSYLAVFRAAPFLGWNFGSLRLAAGLHFDAARMKIGRRLGLGDEEGEATLDLDGTGLGLDAAAFLEPTDSFTIGLTYRGRTGLNLSGGADFEVPRPLTQKVSDQGAKTHVVMPDQLVLGVRAHGANWALLADLEVTLWSVYDRLRIDLADPEMTDIVESANWATTVAVRGGGEMQASPDWTLRAGAYFDPSPVPDATVNAGVPDSSRLGVTVGTSVQLSKQWSLDGFYELMWLVRRGTSSVEALPLTYGGMGHFAGLGLRFVEQPSRRRAGSE